MFGMPIITIHLYHNIGNEISCRLLCHHDFYRQNGSAMDSSEDEDDDDNHVELELSQTTREDAAHGSSKHRNHNRNHELDPILSGTSQHKDNTTSTTAAAAVAPGTASQAQVATNIVVSFVGAGVLGIPNAFRRAGWLLGFSTLCIVSALNVYAMLLLPQVRHALIHKTQTHNSNYQPHGGECRSFGDVGRCILGPKGETLVNVALGISQAGFATAYIIFISANIQATWHISREIVCLACIPGLTLLVQFQEVKSLSPFSLLANISNFCALFAVLLQDYESYDPHNDSIQAVQWSGFLYIVAITIYSMEGVGLILSLESSGKQRAKFPGLLKSMLTAITLFMAFFGTAGYWAFGDETKAPITLNLGTHWSATFVKCALCVGLYFT